MGEPDEREDAELSVTMVGDLASALQLASAQRRSCGEDNNEVEGLVEEAVSDWLDKEIYGPPPNSEDTEPESTAADDSNGNLPVVEFPFVEMSSNQDPAVVNPAVDSAIVESPAAESADDNSSDADLSSADTSGSEAPSVDDESDWRISGRAVLLIALIATLLGFVSWGVAKSTREPAQEAVRVLPPEITTGVLIIDAQPWAEVERIRNHSGIEIPLPDDRFTPLRLDLPPGGYTVSLVRPESALAETCAVPVTASETIRCMPRQTILDADRLLKETGWLQ